MRRRGIGRSVARAAVGTAVIAGTAGAVHHAQDQHWANKEAEQQAAYDQAYQQGANDAQTQQQQYAPPPPQQYAPPPPPPAAPPADDVTTKLQQLAQLYQSGVLTAEEFAAAKQKLLAG
ncbi:MAG: SHOCT domain-containing protein [Chloroflexi bacterium]|nr:MAG: SHOCT domain-containing protein [Chloroflexota bacterium]